MRQDLATLKNKSLLLHVVETMDEAKKGYDGIKRKAGEGMFFSFSKTIPLPISVGYSGDPLDVAWLQHGMVVAMASHLGGILISEADAALELPLGWLKANNIRLGDRLVI